MSTANSLELGDRSRFKSHFRSIPTNEHFSFGFARMIETFGWKKLMMVTQTEDIFFEVATWRKYMQYNHVDIVFMLVIFLHRLAMPWKEILLRKESFLTHRWLFQVIGLKIILTVKFLRKLIFMHCYYNCITHEELYCVTDWARIV